METIQQQPTYAPPAPPVKKTFYCRSGHYEACINSGQTVLGPNGVHVRVGEKHMTFRPCHQKLWVDEQGMKQQMTLGALVTSDPEEIAFIEREMAAGNPDFMTPEQFGEFITPDHEKVGQARQERDEIRRQFEMQNALLQDLQNQNPELHAKLMKGRKTK